MVCSDLWATQPWRYKDWQKGGSLVARSVMKQVANICKVYNYHDSRACSYKRYEILSRLDDMVL
jgi:hypothetical protein